MVPKLKNLVIKPDLRCTARCPTCALRRALHAEARSRRLLSFQEWQDVLVEARRLGGQNLDISGGEPTLYHDLPALIRLAKQQGWVVQINSNGSLMTNGMIRSLVDAGLDRVLISLYSHQAGIHDEMRGLPGLWDRATAAIEEWAAQKKKRPDLEIVAQTILSPSNLSHLPDLLRLLKNLGADGIILSYLEGNLKGTEIFDISQLEDFDRRVRAELQDLCGGWGWPVSFLARRRFMRLFSPKRRSLKDWASGLYHQEQPSCYVPSQMALILAQGDVHPCGVVEYTHEPVMGSLFESSLTDIWTSRSWSEYRKRGNSQCRHCPMLLQDFLPFEFPRWAVLRKRWLPGILR
jgi:radical SAM protein with 4Fe4S-binding SPASM domain